MLRNRFLLIGLAVAALALLYYVFTDTSSADATAAVDPAQYRRQVLDERREKDEYLRTSADSPLPDKAAFKGLTYFAPDPAYRVTARLDRFADKTQKLVVPLTDGSEEVYEKYAHAVFSLDGETCRLLVLQSAEPGRGAVLSVLFRDQTSGKETYGGGRYLELDPKTVTGNTVVLDFNAAYNPYCAYNARYACPLPPKENTLPVAIRAGERYVPHDE